MDEVWLDLEEGLKLILMRRNLGYFLPLVADVGQRGLTLLMTDDVLDRVGAELDAADLWHQFDKAIWTFSAKGGWTAKSPVPPQ